MKHPCFISNRTRKVINDTERTFNLENLNKFGGSGPLKELLLKKRIPKHEAFLYHMEIEPENLLYDRERTLNFESFNIFGGNAPSKELLLR